MTGAASSAMRSRRPTALGLVGSAALGLLAGVVLCGFPSSAPGQKAVPAAAPNGGEYVGAETCKGCHEEAFQKFCPHQDGPALPAPAAQHQEGGLRELPRPGQGARRGGGRQGQGRSDHVREERPHAGREAKRRVPGVPYEGRPGILEGQRARVARRGVHRVPQGHAGQLPRHQLAKPTELETCGTCHIQKRAAQMRSSHMPLREGKMTCTSCHNPHGTVTPALLKENSLERNCYRATPRSAGRSSGSTPPTSRAA